MKTSSAFSGSSQNCIQYGSLAGIFYPGQHTPTLHSARSPYLVFRQPEYPLLEGQLAVSGTHSELRVRPGDMRLGKGMMEVSKLRKWRSSSGQVDIWLVTSRTTAVHAHATSEIHFPAPGADVTGAPPTPDLANGSGTGLPSRLYFLLRIKNLAARNRFDSFEAVHSLQLVLLWRFRLSKISSTGALK